jgi:ketosteroid isomerase-like protein
MHKQTPSLPAEAEALKRFYAALNRNDIPATLELFDPHIEWTDPAEAPGAGTHRGLAAVEAHFASARGTWAEGSCEPERFLVAGDKIVVFVRVRVRLKHETDWREGQLADVYTFRNGRAVGGRSFADRRQGLEWAGAEAADAG